jgi:hypothetical protein
MDKAHNWCTYPVQSMHNTHSYKYHITHWKSFSWLFHVRCSICNYQNILNFTPPVQRICMDSVKARAIVVWFNAHFSWYDSSDLSNSIWQFFKFQQHLQPSTFIPCFIYDQPTDWLYGAEHYWRGHQLCSHLIVSQHYMEPEGSIPHSQEFSTCPYPEPDQSSPHHPNPTSPRSILILSTHLHLGLPIGLLPSGLPTNNLCTFLLNSIIQSSLLCNFLHPPVTSLLFGSNILLSTLFSNSISLCFSLNVRDQVSHPYWTTGKIIVLHTPIFTFFNRRQYDRWF